MNHHVVCTTKNNEKKISVSSPMVEEPVVVFRKQRQKVQVTMSRGG